jgi:hydrogenase maturation protease
MVIGYGNAYRRDDGAGLALAAKLVEYFSNVGIRTRLLTGAQLLPEMAGAMAEDNIERLLFVDTAAPGTSCRIQISRVAMDVTSPTLGHQLDPATLLAFAALLFDSHPHAWLVTIPGVDFAHGEGFSKEVDELLNDVPMLAGRLLDEMKEIQYA